MMKPSMNKKTTQLDGDHSQASMRMIQLEEVDDTPISGTDGKKWRKTLTKKDSLYFRPNESECKVIDVIVLKV
jgi:hypothetical protein